MTFHQVRVLALLSILFVAVLPAVPAGAEDAEAPVYRFVGENSAGEFVTFDWQPDGHEDHLANCFARAPYDATCSNEGHDGLPAMHGFFYIVDGFRGVITSTINDGENYRTLACYVDSLQIPLCVSEGAWPEAVPWRQDCVTAGQGFWVCSSNHLPAA